MKTAIVISDTHGFKRGMDEMSGLFAENDYIIHLGDTSTDGNYLRRIYGEKCFLLNGNCDATDFGENELVIEIEGVKIFATHGHLYSVKRTLEKLSARAAELGCKVALFGHTHTPTEREVNGVLCLNPGAMSRYSGKNYLYLAICGESLTYKLVNNR